MKAVFFIKEYGTIHRLHESELPAGVQAPQLSAVLIQTTQGQHWVQFKRLAHAIPEIEQVMGVMFFYFELPTPPGYPQHPPQPNLPTGV